MTAGAAGEQSDRSAARLTTVQQWRHLRFVIVLTGMVVAANATIVLFDQWLPAWATFTFAFLVPQVCAHKVVGVGPLRR